MHSELLLVKIDSKYCDYLRNYDNKVPFNFKQKELRPFIGVLFYVNDCKYFAPLSSPKVKHLKMKNNVDFLKLKSGHLGAINFNNMIPVTDNNIELLDLNKSCKSEKEIKYQNLLKEQLFWLNRNKQILYRKSKKLYDNYINQTLNKKIADRCCNFPLLEQKCLEYPKNQENNS